MRAKFQTALKEVIPWNELSLEDEDLSDENFYGFLKKKQLAKIVDDLNIKSELNCAISKAKRSTLVAVLCKVLGSEAHQTTPPNAPRSVATPIITEAKETAKRKLDKVNNSQQDIPIKAKADAPYTPSIDFQSLRQRIFQTLKQMEGLTDTEIKEEIDTMADRDLLQVNLDEVILNIVCKRGVS